MHWVMATEYPTGVKVPVNLAAIFSMRRAKVPDNRPGSLVGKHTEITMLFIGGIAVTYPGGQRVLDYANVQVIETPDQLFKLPKMEVGGPVTDPGHESLKHSFPMIDTPNGPRPAKVR